MITLLLASSLFYWNEFSDIHSAYGPHDWVNYGHGAVPNYIERPQKHHIYRPKKKVVVIDDLSDIENDSISEPDSLEVQDNDFNLDD